MSYIGDITFEGKLEAFHATMKALENGRVCWRAAAAETEMLARQFKNQAERSKYRLQAPAIMRYAC